ncbi:tetratricopeptide repeat protein [Oceanobacter mangrovi]|uniref:tetratricopeptide repeat protein n=1 Tax=Oceanobacter mangrovi TaxID=2862510 RepID=UPI001C8DAA8D|nr:tetratricopeptide repeat protein [Oceanobacter mangrovi]
MAELPEKLYSDITLLCKQGDELAKSENLEEAKVKVKYISALKLLPDNINEWEAATWIYVAIGDIHFRMGNYEKCFKCFYNAAQCPKGLGNPFIHLRLGQMYYEQGNMSKAADELTRAYMGAGIDILMEDDPKYLEFLETKIEI